MDAGPDPPARRPLPKRPRLDRPRLNLLAWLHSTLEPKRRLRLPEGEVSAFVTSIADRLLAGALDDGSSVTGRSLKEFFTRAGPEASLDFLRKRHLAHDVAVWLLDAARRGAAQRGSFLGRAGRFVEPVVRPLGWDWRIGCAAIASFPAREVVLGTLGVIYNLGDLDPGDAGATTALERRLKAARWDGTNRPVFTLPVALSIMVFFALCAQCASTLVVIGRETASWVWPIVTFVYMTVLAWLGAFAIYRIGLALGW